MGAAHHFADADAGGERAGAIYCLIGAAKINGIGPEANLRHVITHIDEQPIKCVDELLPWNVARIVPRVAAGRNDGNCVASHKLTAAE